MPQIRLDTDTHSKLCDFQLKATVELSLTKLANEAIRRGLPILEKEGLVRKEKK